MSPGYESHELAVAVADLLADPGYPSLPIHQPWWRQSLALGVPGIALLQVELAAAGLRTWQHAHLWLTAATSGPVTAGADSHPFHGAPAFAHVLASVASHTGLSSSPATTTSSRWTRRQSSTSSLTGH
ncbi:hypothetical protein [Micromonospora sp. LOL_024]|uniref:hypothetical protein n=1 Tax=Micromonospora sp. LOL_024 TaxID=3345412 RepID=UPI003A8ABA14